MSTASESSDARFYEMLHHLVTRRREQAPAERRGGARREFAVVQRVALLSDGRLPEPESFFEVVCHDLSTTGFSFFSSRSCEDEHLVVNLDAPEGPLYVAARVVREQRLAADARGAYLVGCEFIDRLPLLGPPS